ncbi:VOC family protein [Chromobacterium phragmitis]|uniref:Glyoxalase n=1 Tax=Chromobacterium phragmitis TaxID=2202141 RepID=A0A344UG61_9NEIS|nr:VOC family protein [Chromobacterium phragmitis]AXE34259.1 glyoxalase [Chromobacterium phragmitis]
MKVQRIVANIAAADPAAVDGFYRDVLGLEMVMDHGWIRIYASDAAMQPQISFAREGGAGTLVPALSVEVDDVEQALANVRASGIAVEYGPVSEPWGVRRFFVRDPLGHLINILQHQN